MLRGLSFISAIALLLSSCNTKDPAAEIPTYLYIPAFAVDNSQSDLDLYSHNINDVWVYIDNSTQGAYELPALIPIAQKGNHQLEIRPGIKNAGISNARRTYPYYKESNLGIYNFKPGATDTIIPTTFYNDDPKPIIIAWEEQFEDLGPSYEIDPTSDTVITIINKSEEPENVFRDSKSGGIFMDETHFKFEMHSPTLRNLPKNNIPIYLEINYKTNHEFLVGLYMNNKSEQIPIYIVKEQENWNKIYLDFSSYIQSSLPGTNFNIFIGFVRQSDNTDVKMYLDNIKLIHY